MERLSRRDRRVVAEFTTIISVWADTIDMVIKITSLQHLHCQLPSPVNAVTSRRSGSDMKIPAVAMGTPSILKHVRMPEQASQPQGRRPRFTSEEDAQLVDLKQNGNLPWKQIERFFPGRSIGTLRVHYCT